MISLASKRYAGPHNDCLASLAHFTLLIYPSKQKSLILAQDLVSHSPLFPKPSYQFIRDDTIVSSA
jgi:hypothetical protein